MRQNSQQRAATENTLAKNAHLLVMCKKAFKRSRHQKKGILIFKICEWFGIQERDTRYPHTRLSATMPISGPTTYKQARKHQVAERYREGLTLDSLPWIIDKIYVWFSCPMYDKNFQSNLAAEQVHKFTTYLAANLDHYSSLYITWTEIIFTIFYNNLWCECQARFNSYNNEHIALKFLLLKSYDILTNSADRGPHKVVLLHGVHHVLFP